MSTHLNLTTRIIAYGHCLIISTLFSSVFYAQTIGTWSFAGTTAGTPGTHTTVGAADFSPAIPARAFNGATEYYGTDGWPTGGWNAASYLQFTLAPTVGHALDISSIVLRMRRSSTGTPSGTGPTAWSIRSSRDAYATNIATGALTHTLANYTVLPVGFGGITVPVTFRVYGYMATTSGGGTSRLVFDNIQVTGFGSILPVKLISFDAHLDQHKIQIEYSLAGTEEASQYTIERSLDGVSFDAIHSLTEREARDLANYSYADPVVSSMPSRVFYRLMITPLGGMVFYSRVIAIELAQDIQTLRASIFDNTLTVFGLGPMSGTLELLSATGQHVLKKQFAAGSGNRSLQFKIPELSPGVYHLVISSLASRKSLSVLVR